MPDTDATIAKLRAKRGKQKSAVSYKPGDVIQIYGPCKLVHTGGQGGRFEAFRPAETKQPHVRRGKRVAKSKAIR